MPGIKIVAVKSEEQQAILALHRMRQQQLVKFRTAQINGLRGLLTEYGEVMAPGSCRHAPWHGRGPGADRRASAGDGDRHNFARAVGTGWPARRG